MYMLKMQLTVIKCLKSNIDPSWLQHQRCGHINFNPLHGLPKLVRGIHNLSLPPNTLCESYISRKQHREKFPSHQHHIRVPLDLVHANICEPMQTPTLAKCRYMLIFTNDYSWMSWLYLLQTKSKAFDTFIKFKTLIEKQLGFHLNNFQKYYGDEFISNNFK